MQKLAFQRTARLRFQDFCHRGALTAAQDWSVMSGTDICLENPRAAIQESFEVPRTFRDPCIFFRGTFEGALEGDCIFLLPFPDAVTLSGKIMMMPESEIEKKRLTKEYSRIDVDAFKEIGNLLCGSAANGYREALDADLSLVQQETRLVQLAKRGTDPARIFPPRPFATTAWDLRVPGCPASGLLQAFPLPVVERALKALGVETRLVPLKGLVLLLDEDDRSSIRLRPILEGSGYGLKTVTTMMGAFDAIEEEHVDLVMLDVDLSKIDAFTVLRRFVTDERSRHIPVVMCGKVTGTERVIRAVQVGAKDFIAKPFQAEICLGKVKKFVG